MYLITWVKFEYIGIFGQSGFKLVPFSKVRNTEKKGYFLIKSGNIM